MSRSFRRLGSGSFSRQFGSARCLELLVEHNAELATRRKDVHMLPRSPGWGYKLGLKPWTTTVATRKSYLHWCGILPAYNCRADSRG